MAPPPRSASRSERVATIEASPDVADARSVHRASADRAARATTIRGAWSNHCLHRDSSICICALTRCDLALTTTLIVNLVKFARIRWNSRALRDSETRARRARSQTSRAAGVVVLDLAVRARSGPGRERRARRS